MLEKAFHVYTFCVGNYTAHMFTALFSNRTENLYAHLKEKLFAKNTHPFTRRLIVVPSAAMKSWLMMQMAKDPDLGIATGLEIGFLDENLDKFTKSAPKLSSFELTLTIEKKIRNVMSRRSTLSEQEKILWAPLFDYAKSDKRITSLSEILSSLFIRYGNYGDEMLQKWEADPCQGWQQMLWHTIFGEGQWSYRNRDLKKLIKEKELHTTTPTQLHLFALSHFTPMQHTFFTHLSKFIPVYYYLLSPCHLFWSDITSDRENAQHHSYWKKRGVSETQLQALDEYLRDRNPLLANFGLLGRKLAEQVEHSSDITVENYAIPKAAIEHNRYQDGITEDFAIIDKKPSLTLLEGVQLDMLLLHNPEKNSKLSFPATDDSIQIHISHSPLREVQILYDNLIQLMHVDPHLEPGDIIVMVPDVEVYAPFIKSVFNATESLIRFQLLDLKPASSYPFVQQFFHLIKLPQARWGVSAIMDLFSFPSFIKKHGFTSDDLKTIEEWVRAGLVRWGFDAADREALLQHTLVDHSEAGTWNHLFKRLYLNLVVASSDACSISSTETALLGKWSALMQSLKCDLDFLYDGKERSFKEWAEYLSCICESYFTVDTVSSEGHAALIIQLEALKRADHPIPFSTALHYLETALNQLCDHSHRHLLNAVRFCSLKPMRAIPAKVIALLGMEEGAFPRSSAFSSLDLMKEFPEYAHCPHQIDFDRYLFLEILLSVRQTLLISYSGYDAQNGNEQAPSLLVTEFLTYLNSSYEISGKEPSQYCIKRHPFHPFDPSYFSASSALRSFSQEQFAICNLLYANHEKATHGFIPQFSLPDKNNVSLPSVTLKELSSFARNPLKVYFNKTLGIYLDNIEDRQLQDCESFYFSALHAYGLKKEALNQSIDAILQKADKENILPIGPFKAVAIDKIKKEISTLQDNMKSYPDVFSISFSDQYNAATRTQEGNWELPALEVNSIKIEGTIPYVCARGLITDVKDTRNDIVKVWPEYLLLNALIDSYQLPIEKNLLFLRNGKEKPCFFNDPKSLLSSYIEYYRSGLTYASPLIPEWIPDLLKLEPKAIQEKISHSLTDPFNPMFNPYVKWALNAKQLPELSPWKPIAEKLFSELFASWYPSV